MKRVSLIFGTRPEAIKMAPIVLAMRTDPRFDARVCVTAQHREMLDQVLDVFGIKPDADLNLMRPGQTLAGLTARALEAIDEYLAADRPELVLVQGDTTTVLSAALAAFYRKIPIGHVEAGLRTGDLQAPWPEEANRVLTTRLAELHFAPTSRSRDNLLKEGVPDSKIFVTGNTVIDALFLALERVRKYPPEIPGLPVEIARGPAPLVLITGHRRENFGGGFESICRAIARLADDFPETQFVYPVHLNPNVREPVQRILGDGVRRNVWLIRPLDYLAFVALMDRSTVILTDSGGVQEEAPSLGKPVMVMRETTERVEAVEAGVVTLVGTDFNRIVGVATEVLKSIASRDSTNSVCHAYGDGKAATRIVKHCSTM